MHAFDVAGYSYAADTYHAWCVLDELKERYELPASVVKVIDEESNEVALDAIAAFLKVDRMDEHTFDSGDFPKVIFADQIRWETEDEENGPWADVCGRCHESFEN